MNRFVHRLKEEFVKMVGVAAFFSCMFAIISIAESLTVAGSNVKVVSLTAALIGGLVAAKIVLILDLLPFVNLFPNRPLIWNIAWKSPIYIAASFVFRYLEITVKSLFSGMGFTESQDHVAEEFAKPVFWANHIWISVLLILFLTFRELTHALGKEKVRMLFFGR